MEDRISREVQVAQTTKKSFVWLNLQMKRGFYDEHSLNAVMRLPRVYAYSPAWRVLNQQCVTVLTSPCLPSREIESKRISVMPV